MSSANAISGSAIGSGTAAANSGQHKSLSSTDSFYRDKVIIGVHKLLLYALCTQCTYQCNFRHYAS
jgi:hypothetical protein